MATMRFMMRGDLHSLAQAASLAPPAVWWLNGPMRFFFALLLSVPIAVVCMLSGWFSVEPLNLILPVVLATALAVLLLPRDSGRRGAVPSVRLDERDTMFSRAELVPGSSAYEQYYRLHPEQRERDDAIRALPGLLAPGTSQYNSQLFAATAALLAEIAELRGRVDGVSAVVRSEISATAASDLVRGWASDDN